MKINLWVVVDKHGRIYYTGATREMCLNFIPKLPDNEFKVVNLEGVF